MSLFVRQANTPSESALPSGPTANGEAATSQVNPANTQPPAITSQIQDDAPTDTTSGGNESQGDNSPSILSTISTVTKIAPTLLQIPTTGVILVLTSTITQADRNQEVTIAQVWQYPDATNSAGATGLEVRLESGVTRTEVLNPTAPTSTSSTTPTTGSTSSGSTAPATTTKVSATPGNNKNGLGPGAVAGAAIGAAIGAALIAFLVTFFCLRRRRNTSSNRGAIYTSEKSSLGHPWETFLPQSADDNTVKAAVERLYTLIDQHVENYYGSNVSGVIPAQSEAGIATINSGFITLPADQYLISAAPLPVLKHLYAWAILSRLSPTTTGEDSLLPVELARAPVASASSPKNRSSREDEAMLQAYQYWRVLTAHLLYPQAVRNSTGKRDIRSNGAAVGDSLTTTFEPWLKSPGEKQDAEQHLRNVLKTASETGLLIESQRSTFRFEWDVLQKSKADGNIVVMPAFEKSADERGEVLARRQLLVKPTIEGVVSYR